MPYLKAKLQCVPADDVSESVGESISVEDKLARNVNFAAHRYYAVVKHQLSK